uniref:PDZ domain-containing protein n=1 Tax=Trichobilharzia regenti TaxID=157069 RepID=A0AA85JEI4_TRIRE|nr:unnamed protein product [Trichobilharzia regenti]
MDFEKVNLSVLKLNKESRKSGNIYLQRLTHSVYSILQSELLTKCYDLINVLQCPSVLDDLDYLIPRANINEVQTGLPPFSMERLKKKIINLHLPQGTRVFTVQLPESQPKFEYRRSGVVLRQAVIKGEVESLFVSGVEHDSPASKVMDLHMGDCIYAISGYPLDWHTLEQLRHKLIELDGLSPNSNIYELATYLLNRPYQNSKISRKNHDSNNTGIFKVTTDIKNSEVFEPPMLILFRYPKTSFLWKDQIENDELMKPMNTVKQDRVNCYETVLENNPEDTGLGLQIGCDEDDKGIYIVSIFKNSQAEKDGVLKEGDHIIEVNYQNIEGLEAKQALKKVKSVCRNAKFVHIKCSRNLRADDCKSAVTDDCKEIKSEDAVVINNEDRGVSCHESCNQKDNNHQTANTTTGSISQTESDGKDNENRYPNIKDNNGDNDDESILGKWSDMFDPDVNILLVHYTMENSDCGLGIGIESIVQDEELIDGNQYHHYIVEINSEGPIGRDGTLSVGDEILEVNKIVCLNKDHLELARIFHTTPTKGFLVCARFPNETYSGDIKTESGSDEMIVTNAIPFNHSLSDGEVPSVDFEEQIFDKHSSNGLYSESKENSMHEIINVNETDQNYSSDIDDSQQPIRLLTITSTGLNTSSLKTAFQVEQIKLDDDDDDKIPESPIVESAVNETNSEEQISTECVTTNSFPRLPMAEKVANFTRKKSNKKFTSRHSCEIPQSTKDHSDNGIQLNDIINQDEIVSVKVMKKAGEILGLELEMENGDERGIPLAYITPGSPVDRLKCHNKNKSTEYLGTDSYYSNQSEASSDDIQYTRVPIPGDHILSVSDYSFQHISAFTALRLLRKLISYSGFIKYQSIDNISNLLLQKFPNIYEFKGTRKRFNYVHFKK